MNKINRQILLCNCGGERIGSDKMQNIREYLEKLPIRVIVVSDLCGLAAKNSDALAEIISENCEYLVLGCFPRTMRLLLEQATGFNIMRPDTNYINLIETPFLNIKDQINAFSSCNSSDTSHREISESSGWPSWYPVIDYSRCTACGQCADFCLFGVYEKSSEKVTVVNHQGCKNLCPACARICPATAIIFPKYKNGGAIGGSEEIDEKEEQQRQAQDIETFLGNDIYMALQRRKVKRQSLIREEEIKRAISERDIALNENKLN
jgi:NAD-dependent dihydropyrimidine dehydrogenase PreA subunit